MVDHLIFDDFLLLLDVHRLFKAQLLPEHHGKVSSMGMNAFLLENWERETFWQMDTWLKIPIHDSIGLQC